MLKRGPGIGRIKNPNDLKGQIIEYCKNKKIPTIEFIRKNGLFNWWYNTNSQLSRGALQKLDKYGFEYELD